MNFNLLLFEQTIDETLLKDGWRLINSKKSAFDIQKSGLHYHFTWKQAELDFIKKGHHISQVNCSCSHSLPCKHVCASLFYFKNQNAIDVSPPIRNYSQHINIHSEYFKYKNEINAILKAATLKNDKTKTKNDVAFIKIFEKFIGKNKLSETKQFYFDLAFITLYYNINKLVGNYFEPQYQKSYERLFVKVITKTNSKQIQALQEATLESVKNSIALQTGAFNILVPLLLGAKVSTLILIQLQNNLAKLTYKQKYNQAYNPLLVMQLLIALKLEKGENVAEEKLMLEWWIAKAEYYLLQEKKQLALNFLKNSALQFQILKSPLYFPLLNYSFAKSKELGNKLMQLHFGEDLLVNSSIFLEPVFNHLLGLVPKKQHAIFLENLLEKIKASNNNTIEKKHLILLKLSKFTELLSLLKSEKQRFNLMHEVAVNLLPNFSNEITATYLNHLVNSCGDSKPFSYQQNIVKKAMCYFSELPVQLANNLKSEALYRIGKNKPIYHFAEKLWLADAGK